MWVLMDRETTMVFAFTRWDSRIPSVAGWYLTDGGVGLPRSDFMATAPSEIIPGTFYMFDAAMQSYVNISDSLTFPAGQGFWVMLENPYLPHTGTRPEGAALPAVCTGAGFERPESVDSLIFTFDHCTMTISGLVYADCCMDTIKPSWSFVGDSLYLNLLEDYEISPCACGCIYPWTATITFPRGGDYFFYLTETVWMGRTDYGTDWSYGRILHVTDCP